MKVEGLHAGRQTLVTKLMIASRKCFAEAAINGNQAIQKKKFCNIILPEASKL
jgi:hypothetical protein